MANSGKFVVSKKQNKGFEILERRNSKVAGKRPDIVEKKAEVLKKKPAVTSAKEKTAAEKLVEKEIKEFHEKEKPVRDKESEGFDFKEIHEDIKEAVKKVDDNDNSKNEDSIKRVPTGITGLDELIEGGFENGSSVLLVGSAGTGKTLFALQFLYEGAVKYNEPGVFISFEEDKHSLYRHSSNFNWNFKKLEKEEMFKVMKYKPHQVEKLMEEGGGTIRDAIRKMGAKRLVIDSITSYGLLFKDDYQKRENILSFFDLLYKWGCTTLVISELPPKLAEVKEGSVGFLTDAIISLYYSKEENKGVRVHSCEILKMRGTKHTNKLLAIGFEPEGIVVYPEVEVF